jgi:hypothetical protein
VLAVLFTLPRLRTLRPAALRKLSSEGTWRSDADPDPGNEGSEVKPVFELVIPILCAFEFTFGACASE